MDFEVTRKRLAVQGISGLGVGDNLHKREVFLLKCLIETAIIVSRDDGMYRSLPHSFSQCFMEFVETRTVVEEIDKLISLILNWTTFHQMLKGHTGESLGIASSEY